MLDQVTARAGRDSTVTWLPGTDGSITHREGVEKTFTVSGDAPASVLELSVVPLTTET